MLNKLKKTLRKGFLLKIGINFICRLFFTDESIVPPGVVMEGFAKFVRRSIKEENRPLRPIKHELNEEMLSDILYNHIALLTI